MKCSWFETYLTTVLCMSTVAWAQEPERDVAEQIAEAFQVARDSLGHQNYTPAISKTLLKEHPKEVLEALKLYEHDPLPRIRLDAYMFDWSIGVSSRDPELREQVTWRLVNACRDADAGVWQYAAERLLSFEQADFTPASKAILHELFMEDPRELRTREIIWVVGVAGMREELARLKSFLLDLDDSRLQEGPRRGSASWPARLARARMGVEEDTLRAIELVEREKNGSTRVCKLLKHLAYTRQPAAFAHVARYLDSDERFPPVKPTAPGELYSQRAMGILAENMPNFPVKDRHYADYTDAEIDQARAWMRNHSLELND